MHVWPSIGSLENISEYKLAVIEKAESVLLSIAWSSQGGPSEMGARCRTEQQSLVLLLNVMLLFPVGTFGNWCYLFVLTSFQRLEPC